MFFVKKGVLKHNVDYEEYAVTKDNLFFISQGQLHFWEKSVRENMSGYRLMFTEEFFQQGRLQSQFLFELIYLDNVYQTPLLNVPESSPQISIYFDLMLQEFDRNDSSLAVLNSLLFLVLTETQRIASTVKKDMPDKHQLLIYKQFLYLLEENFDKKWTVQNYADRLHITPRNLNRILHSVTRQNFTEIYQNRVTLEAKRLLTFSGMTVSQISESVGFDDISYFCRFFKKQTTLAPLDFRAKYA